MSTSSRTPNRGVQGWRRRRLGVIAVGAAACIGGVAGVATAVDTASSPTSKNGVVPFISSSASNRGGNVTCTDLGYEFDSSSGKGGYDWGGDNSAFAAHFAALGIVVNVTDGKYVAWSSTFPISAVVVKGGSDANVYAYAPASLGPDSDLASPPNSSDQPAGLSNLRFCWNAPKYDVSITKKADTPTVDPGGTATWTVTVKNTGVDPIPFEMIEVTDDDADTIEEIGTPPDSLAPRASFSWKASKAVGDKVDLCGTEILNSASVSLKDYDTKTTDDESTPDIPITVDGEVCVPDVSITKEADTPTVDPGGTATWTVTVTNSGQVPVPFADIEVTDTDADTIEEIGTPPDSLAPRASFSWKASKAVGDKIDLCGTEILNSASVTLKGSATPTPGDDSTGDVPILIDGEECNPPPEYNVAIQKTANSATVAPDGTASWTVTVFNTGKDDIPWGLIKVTDEGSVLTPNATEPTVLAAGGSFSWTATKQVGGTDLCGTEVTNTASVALDVQGFTPETDDQTGLVAMTVDGEACAPPPPPPPPPSEPPLVTAFRPAGTGLEVIKTGTRRALVGGRVQYTIRVRNLGATDATGVVLRDIAPGVLAWRSRPSGSTLRGRTVRWDIGTIPAGQTVTKKVTLLVKFTKAKRVCNIAAVSSADAGSDRTKACTTLVTARRPATPVTG